MEDIKKEIEVIKQLTKEIVKNLDETHKDYSVGCIVCKGKIDPPNTGAIFCRGCIEKYIKSVEKEV